MLRHLMLSFLLFFLAFANVPYGELASHNGTSENSFLFTGEQRDTETNNYYLRARYYSPNIARFLSYDSYNGKVINPLSQNHYLYAGGNPVMYVDPSGHFFGFLSGISSFVLRFITFDARASYTVQRGTALTINAYYIGLGMKLRKEAILSIEYVFYTGGSKEAIKAAYKKYYYSIQIISSMTHLMKLIDSAIGWAQSGTSFANAIRTKGISLPVYRKLSQKIGGGLQNIAKAKSRNAINQDLDNLYNLIGSAYTLLNKAIMEIK